MNYGVTKNSVTFFSIGILVILAWKLLHFILIILTAVVLASFMEPAVLQLKKIKIPRYVSVPFLFLVGIGVIIGTIALLIPVFTKEMSDLVSLLPKGSPLAKGISTFSQEGFSEATLQRFGGSSNIFTALSNIWEMITSSGLGNIARGLFDIGILAVLTFYLAIQEKGVDHFLRAVTPREYENRVLILWQRTEKKIGDWFGGQVIAAIIVGVITYGGLLLFQIPYALILAITAAVFDLLPFGTILGAVPAALIGFAVGGFSMGFWIIILYMIIHYIEVYLIQPLIIRKTVGIPIVIMIISVVAWGTLAGILGILLSIPCAILITELLGEQV